MYGEKEAPKRAYKKKEAKKEEPVKCEACKEVKELRELVARLYKVSFGEDI